MTRELGIRIEGIEVFAFHGVLPEEKAQGQEFVFDVELVPNSDRACDTDKLDDAVDYGAITEAVVAIATAEPVVPIERVTVSVHKPHAPIRAAFGDVIVTVTRTA